MIFFLTGFCWGFGTSFFFDDTFTSWRWWLLLAAAIATYHAGRYAERKTR